MNIDFSNAGTAALYFWYHQLFFFLSLRSSPAWIEHYIVLIQYTVEFTSEMFAWNEEWIGLYDRMFYSAFLF